jgi:hypothetical protein
VKLAFLTLFGSLVAAPLAAQQPAASPSPADVTTELQREQRGGPRLQPEFPSYRPTLHEKATTTAAAETTTITITTLGLVVIAVLLIILLT